VIRLTLALLIALTAIAHAEREPLPEVELTIVGGDAVAAVVIEHVASWFEGTELSTHQQATLDPAAVLAKAGHPGVHVWIVLLDPKRVQIFFAVEDAKSTAPRYLMTVVTLDAGLDEIGIEELGQVVFPSADALWIGELETPRVEIEHELAQTTRSYALPTHRSAVHVAIGAEYQAIAQGHGINQSVGGTAAVLGHLGLRAHVAVLLPREASDGGVTVGFRGASIGAGGAIARPLARHTRLLGELGGGLDMVAYRPAMLPDPVLPTAGGIDAQPIVYARVGASVALGACSLAIEAVANVHLRRTHYDIELDGMTHELVVPWLLQPGVAATLTW